MEDPNAVIGLLAAAVVALWGYVVWLNRLTLNRADKRIEALEAREDSTLNSLAKNVESIQGMMATMVEAFREVRLSLEYARRPREP